MPDLTVWPTDGADGSVSSEARWRKMARTWVPSGVDTSPLSVGGGGFGALAPTLAAGPTINVAAGSVWLDGHFAELAAPASVPATANGLLVVRFTPADNHAELLYRDAATAPQQTLATWELAIAQMTAGALADRRQFAQYGGLAPTPACLLALTAAQSIPNNTVAPVLFNTAGMETVDTHNMHDPATNPNRVTVPLRGVYGLSAFAVWNGVAGGTLRNVMIRNSAGAIIIAQRGATGSMVASNLSMEASPSGDVALAAGDWVEMAVAHDQGAALNLLQGRLAVVYRGPMPYGAGM